MCSNDVQMRFECEYFLFFPLVLFKKGQRRRRRRVNAREILWNIACLTKNFKVVFHFIMTPFLAWSGIIYCLIVANALVIYLYSHIKPKLSQSLWIFCGSPTLSSPSHSVSPIGIGVVAHMHVFCLVCAQIKTSIALITFYGIQFTYIQNHFDVSLITLFRVKYNCNRV